MAERAGRAEPQGGDDAVVVAEIEKSKAEVVRVQLRTYQGRRYADLRTYYWDESGPEEELKPTRKGVSLRVEQLPELRAAIDALAKAAEVGPTGAATGRGGRRAARAQPEAEAAPDLPPG